MKQLVIFLDQILIWIMLAALIPQAFNFQFKIKKFLKPLKIGKLNPAQQTALVTFISAVTAWSIAQLIKNLYPTPRPYIVNNIEPWVAHPPTDGAFLSAHTATAFAIATGIYLSHPGWGRVCYILAATIGLMRILGRVHYPIDILAGAALGIAISLTLNRIHVMITR